jgi:flagellar hook assembly protein FlgD
MVYYTEEFGRVLGKVIPPSATITGIAHIDSSLNRDIAQTFTGVVYASNGVDTDSVVFEITVVPGTQTSIGESTQLPMKFALHQNYPNPFNPITTLRYDLPENSLVNIIIYDLLGRQVKTLVNQTQNAGFKSIIWNATNNYGKPVSAGVYLYQIQAGEFVQTKKMVLLK